MHGYTKPTVRGISITNRWATPNLWIYLVKMRAVGPNKANEQDRYVRMRQIYETIDRQGYQWIVVLVAGLGFLLDGYTVRLRGSLYIYHTALKRKSSC